MLTARPCSWLSGDYDVHRDGEFLTSVLFTWFREGGSFDLAGEEFQIRREAGWGEFVLSQREERVCTALKPSAFFRSFELASDGRTLTLAAKSALSRCFVLKEDGKIVGEIWPAFLTRRATIDLPGFLPLAVQAFLFWLVAIMWRRAARSSSS